ncbi:patatin phospholipase domain-containing protein [Salix suchowensis]|nr:patatin phospholipase domain-containing protein [Salix suchowensis]
MGWVFSSKPRNLKFSSMAPPPPSLSSILPPSHLSVLPPINPYLTHRYMLSPRPSQSLSFTTRYSPDNKQNDNKITYPPPPPPPQEKTSFGVATGELFLGIASRFLRSRNKNSYHNDKVSGLSLLEKSDDGNVDYEERIGAVMEDEVEPVVIWEQRVKDIEAEKERPAVTSPGFCFSAAGLLFPYHLGVAHLLIEKGYIKETTPLAGSSAGAIVCAVIASGAGMQEALTATKVLAEDCRLRGTAFRLGAVLRDVLEKFLPDDIHVRCNGRFESLLLRFCGGLGVC